MLKISKKLYIIGIVSMLVILTLSAMLWQGKNSELKNLSDFYTQKLAPLDKLRRMQLLYREVEYYMLGVISDFVAPVGAIKHLELAVGEIDSLWDYAEQTIPPGENTKERKSIAKGYSKFLILFPYLIKAYEDEDIDLIGGDLYDKWLDCKKFIFRSVDKYIKDQANQMRYIYMEQIDSTRRYKIFFAIIIGLVIIGGLSFFILLARSIINPLHSMTNLLQGLVEGKGDLTKKIFTREVDCSKVNKCGQEDCEFFQIENNRCMVEVGSLATEAGKKTTCPKISTGQLESCWDCKVMKMLVKDEIDEVAFSIDLFVQKIRSMVVKIHQEIVHLSSSTKHVSIQSEQFSQNAQIEASNMEEISASVEEISAGAKQMSNSVVTLNELIKDVVEMKLKPSVNQGQEMKKQMDKVLQAKKDVDSDLANIQNLGKFITGRMDESMKVSTDIQDIIESVTSVSDQISLLSLNAAIESARAGDAGRGFAVVADEIAKLSDKTQENVNQIKSGIDNAVQVISKASNDMQQVTEYIKSIVNKIVVFGETVDVINHHVNSDTLIKKEIEVSASTMSRSANEIEKGMAENSLSLSEIGKSLEQASDIIQANAGSAEEMLANSDETSAVAEALKSLVEKFKT